MRVDPSCTVSTSQDLGNPSQLICIDISIKQQNEQSLGNLIQLELRDYQDNLEQLPQGTNL